MNKRPWMDRSLLIPIGISSFSVVGISIILLIVYLDKPQVVVSTDPTTTPFKYLLLATETSIPDPAVETAPPEGAFPEEPTGSIPIDTPEEGFSAFSTQASSQANPSINNTLLQSVIPPAASTTLLNVIDSYDDTDSRLEYDGNWVSQTNIGNAYQKTLFVSNHIGNDLIFTFTGQQIIIGYLGDPGLGIITISIDDEEFQLDQSVGKEWTSPSLSNTEHFVIIFHESGNSVNLDYINILGSN